MLEGIFERTVRPWFVKILRCHCHLQCQICFGLGDGQDTQGFSNIGVSLRCSHYFYTKVCSRMNSGGDLCHVGTSSRSETMLHHWCGSGKYTTVLCFGIGGGDARAPAPFHTWGVKGFWSVL